MKILHYALGFPPYRTGGLTKYCTDLMLTQKEQGHDVFLLWPGHISIINKKLRIKKGTDWNNIGSFELVNPLPVSLDEGIVNIEAYIASVDTIVYQTFLEKCQPDVIHIHSLMGLHKEFLDVAKRLKIRTIFTSHDYFGICPKVTLFHDGMVCDTDHDCEDCIRCNQSALSLKKIVLLQSRLYRMIKNTDIIKKLRRRHRQFFFDERKDGNAGKIKKENTGADYRRLRNYYISMLNEIDMIHFNSTVAEAVYRKYFTPKLSKVISITHRDIKDHRKLRKFSNEKLRLTYLGPAKVFKGFNFLFKVLDRLWADGVRNFELHIYTKTFEERPYITHKQDGYLYSQLEGIFENTDLVIVPSLWYETFGFSVLEALSYGVPVLISENVGAKDVCGENYVSKFGDFQMKIKQLLEMDLCNAIKGLEKINPMIFDYSIHAENMMHLYKA